MNETLSVDFPPGPALDIGCGFKGAAGENNLPYLAVDIEYEKVENVTRKLGLPAVLADAQNLPLPGNLFSRVFALDVLEHVRDDWLALGEIFRVLLPGGCALVTVPAHQWLWSAHDESEMHIRRYGRGQFLKLCREVGFHVEKSGYFNTILFPLAAAWRLLSRRFYRSRAPRDDFYMPPAPVNVFLENLFGLESRTLGLFPLPFGLSLYAELRKP